MANQNKIIESILNHRSIRRFTEQKIDAKTINLLLDCAFKGSTSNYIQCTSIIRITDLAIREKIMQYSANQKYILSAPEFFVFCMDFNRHKQLCPKAELDYSEVTLIGAIDVAIAAQNMFVAAESLGLGGVYIGSMRNEMEKIDKLLNLPEHCTALFGIALGYPNQEVEPRPRLPQQLTYFENKYQTKQVSDFISYNEEVKQYYKKRSNLNLSWVENIANTLEKPVRPHVLPYLNSKGFNKK